MHRTIILKQWYYQDGGSFYRQHNDHGDEGDGDVSPLNVLAVAPFHVPDGDCDAAQRALEWLWHAHPEYVEQVYVGQFVNVYLIDKAYGGPEEGGWWYQCGELVRSTQEVDDARIEMLLGVEKAWCDEENKHRRSDISSVLSEGRYVAYVEDTPGKSYPERRPHYE